MEEILCQAGSVGIYDGDLKQVRPRTGEGGHLLDPLLHCIPIKLTPIPFSPPSSRAPPRSPINASFGPTPLTP